MYAHRGGKGGKSGGGGGGKGVSEGVEEVKLGKGEGEIVLHSSDHNNLTYFGSLNESGDSFRTTSPARCKTKPVTHITRTQSVNSYH